MDELYYMTKYIFIINFAKDNTIVYFIILNLFILIIILSLVFFIITTVKMYNNNLQSLWSIYILGFIFPFISSSFFGQIFYTLLTVFTCEDNSDYSYFSSSYKCLEGIWFYVQAPLSMISIIILFVISYITNLIFYNPMCLRAKNRKIHSLTDVIFLFTKIVMNILFIFFRNVNDNYPLIILSIITSGINFYFLSIYQGYSNKNIFFINNFLALSLLWGFISLFLGKILNSLIGFNGTSYLFLISIILILIYVFYKSKHDELLFTIDKSKIDSSISYYKYILQLQTLIEDKNKSRENKLILKSFLIKIEENCVKNDCFLKRYLICLSNGADCDILLFYHMQSLFEDGLIKYNNDLTLTISYIYFLVKRLSKKKKALILFESINKKIYSIDKLFNIYRCKKILETLWTGFDGKDKENIESEDVAKLFDYKNNVSKFKEQLNRISLLYYDFWLALFSNNCEGKEEFKTLNDIGSKIFKLLNPIEESFKLIHCIKNDDIEILKLYSGYIKNILNDENKFEEYHNILSNISKDYTFETREIDYASFDISNLHKEKKDVEYFIISALDKDEGERKIISMSLGLSTIIGYQQQEIIGKDINILIPKIFQNAHNLMLDELTTKIKFKLYETLSNNIKYIPEIINQTVYFKTKSNFLKQLEFKSYLVQNEEGEHIFIVEIIRGSSFQTSWNETGEEPPSCVLTDKNFIIQTFTADCCDILGLNANVINANFEITSCILQFEEDISNHLKEKSNLNGQNSTYLFDNSDFLSNSNQTVNINKKDRKSNKNIINSIGNTLTSSKNLNNIFRQIQNNNYDVINIMKNKIRRKLVKTKYINPQIITWKINEMYINDLKYEGKKNIKIDKRQSNKNNNFYFNSNKFLMHVKECRISGTVIGYYFYFKKMNQIKFRQTESNEEINFFKRYISNTAEDEQSDYNIKPENDKKELTGNLKQINKSNTEQSNRKSGFYISQQLLNKDNKDIIKCQGEHISETGIHFDKPNINLNDENYKNYSLYLISDVKDDTIIDNKKIINDIALKEQIAKDKEPKLILDIKQNFIPFNSRCFDFDIETMSYIPSKILSLNDTLKQKFRFSGLLTFHQRKLEEIQQASSNILDKSNSSSSQESGEGSSSDENESSEYNSSSYISSHEETEKKTEKLDKKEKKEKKEEKKEKESIRENGKENGKETVEKNDKEGENQSPKKKKLTEKVTLKEEKDQILNEIMSPSNRTSKKIFNFKGNSNKLNKYSLNIFQNEYYKVKFDKIRYFYYDHVREMIVEDTKYEKKSKMDELLSDIKIQDFNLENHLFNYTKDLTFSTFVTRESKLKDSKFKRNQLKKQSSKDKGITTTESQNEKKNNNNNSQVDNVKDLENKIKEALNQEDKQKSIEIFLIISIISLLVLLAMGIIGNYYIISQIKDDTSNINLICYSAELRTFYNAAVYYLRELTLVNFIVPTYSNLENYTSYPEFVGNRSEYIKSLRAKIQNIYIETHVLTESLTSSDIPLSDNTSWFLQDKNLTLYVLENNLNIYQITTTFSISLIELNSALYNLAISDTYIQQNVTDAYIFIHNFLNEVGEGIKAQIDIYINELQLRIKKKEIILIVGMVIILILIIIIFVVICFGYKSIIKKKSSYIEGFYEIKLSFIRQSIKNCEHFIYFLKKQKREDDSGLKHDRNSEFTQINEEIEKEYEEEMKIYDNSNSINRNDEFYNFQRRNSTLNHNYNRDSSSIIIFAIIIFIYFMVIFVFFLLVCLTYNNFMKGISRNSEFIFHLQRIQNNVIDFFNGYREYIFDENTIIFGNKSEDYLQLKLEEIFNTKGEDTYFVNSTYSYIKNFKNTFTKFNSENLCTRMEGNFFESEDDCLNYLEGQIKYGYQITSFTLVDLIRIGINFIKYYFNVDMDIFGNLTVYGINDYMDINNDQKFRLYLFNNDTSHSKLNVLFVHALLPYFIDIVNITSNAIIEAADHSDSLFYVFMISYICINVILFITVWLPFIKNMNSVIYNAKKILGIIPIHILSSLANIKKILNLEKNKNA